MLMFPVYYKQNFLSWTSTRWIDKRILSLQYENIYWPNVKRSSFFINDINTRKYVGYLVQAKNLDISSYQ